MTASPKLRRYGLYVLGALAVLLLLTVLLIVFSGSGEEEPFNYIVR